MSLFSNALFWILVGFCYPRPHFLVLVTDNISSPFVFPVLSPRFCITCCLLCGFLFYFGSLCQLCFAFTFTSFVSSTMISFSCLFFPPVSPSLLTFLYLTFCLHWSFVVLCCLSACEIPLVHYLLGLGLSLDQNKGQVCIFLLTSNGALSF